MFTKEQKLKSWYAGMVLESEGYDKASQIGIDSKSTHFIFVCLNPSKNNVVVDVILPEGVPKDDGKEYCATIAKKTKHLKDIDCEEFLGVNEELSVLNKKSKDYKDRYIKSTGKAEVVKNSYDEDSDIYWAISEMSFNIRKFDEIVFLKENKYSEFKFLGKGGFGSVFRCKNPEGKEVAAKVVNAETLQLLNQEVKCNMAANNIKKYIKDRKEKENFEKYTVTGEVKKVSKNDLMAIIEFEYVEGGDIDNKKLVKSSNNNDKSIDYNELRRLAKRVLKDLKILNSKGIAHFDIKPKNILEGKTKKGLPQYKLADFGLMSQRSDPSKKPPQYGRFYEESDLPRAMKLEPEQKNRKSDLNSKVKTLSKARRTEDIIKYTKAKGTLLYFAPELRFRYSSMKGSDASVFFKCDIYSLGISLFQMYLAARADVEKKMFNAQTDLLKTFSKFRANKYLPFTPNDPQEKEFLDFVRYLTIFDPKKRPDAKKALGHPFIS